MIRSAHECGEDVKSAGDTAHDLAVVIPVGYHHALLVPEAVHSVRCGSVLPGSVVIIDDGADPSVPSMIGDGGAQALDITVVKHARRFGRSAARNCGASLAVERGCSWLLFLDADDWLHGTAVAEFVAMSTAKPNVGVFYGQPYEYGPSAGVVSGTGRMIPYQGGRFHPAMFGSVSCFVRADLFAAVGGFKNGMEVWEDPDLWGRIMLLGTKAHQLPCPTIKRRVGNSTPRLAVVA